MYGYSSGQPYTMSFPSFNNETVKQLGEWKNRGKQAPASCPAIFLHLRSGLLQTTSEFSMPKPTTSMAHILTRRSVLLFLHTVFSSFTLFSSSFTLFSSSFTLTLVAEQSNSLSQCYAKFSCTPFAFALPSCLAYAPPKAYCNCKVPRLCVAPLLRGVQHV